MGLGLPATQVTAASVYNPGPLAWHDMNACVDEHRSIMFNLWTEGSLLAPFV